MGARNRIAPPGGRLSDRVKVDAETRLRPNGWSSLEIRMLDLSENGFRAAAEARLPRGGCVSIDIPGLGAVDAQVEWQKDGQFGARFLSPIELGRCGWSMSDASAPLAHLLVQRAAAKGAGRSQAEAHLRRRILAALPMRRDCA